MTSTISPRNDVSMRNERRNSNQFSANQKHYQDLGSDASSLCAHFSWADVITRGNQWWPREMSAVFLSIYLLGKITVDISRWHRRFPRETTSQWETSEEIPINFQPIRSTTKIWVVTRHHYALISPGLTSLRGETSGDLGKCRLFS